MNNNPRQPFVPFTAVSTPPASGNQNPRLTVVQPAQEARAFRPVVSDGAGALLPDLSGSRAVGRGEPRITLHREGDRVVRISVQCGCGQVVELACVY